MESAHYCEMFSVLWMPLKQFEHQRVYRTPYIVVFPTQLRVRRRIALLVTQMCMDTSGNHVRYHVKEMKRMNQQQVTLDIYTCTRNLMNEPIHN